MTIDGYTDVPSNDEERLLKAVVAQPVSAGVCGSGRAFQLYSKVILNPTYHSVCDFSSSYGFGMVYDLIDLVGQYL